MDAKIGPVLDLKPLEQLLSGSSILVFGKIRNPNSIRNEGL